MSKEPVSSIPWRLILSKAPVWALIISHFCHNWGTFILLTWMPTYYNQVFAIFMFICVLCMCMCVCVYLTMLLKPNDLSKTITWNLEDLIQHKFFLAQNDNH